MCIKTKTILKSTDANMLVAYYSKGCDSHEIFDQLKISQINLYKEHLNQHNVIHLNMQQFLSKSCDINSMLSLLIKLVFREINHMFGDVDYID